MGDYRAELQALIAAYDKHGGRWPEADVDALYQAVQRARAALDGPTVPEGREPAAVEGQPSDQELLCIAAEAIDGYGDAGIKPGEYESFTDCAVEAYGSELCAFARAVLARWGNQQPRPIPVSERLPGPEGCGVGDWLPIDTAPRDGTEILASDYDAIEIVSWYKGRLELNIPGEWVNIEGDAMYPTWWQPLPDHPPLPEESS